MLEFPCERPPAPGEALDLTDGIVWMRLPLPYMLDHVNVFLLRDRDGYLAVDTGVDDAPTRAAWQRLFARIGGPHAVRRLLLTHHHTDHSGAAGWLQDATGCETLSSELEIAALRRSVRPEDPNRPARLLAHYGWLGCPPEEAAGLVASRWREPDVPAPEPVTLVAAADSLSIDGTDWTAMHGRGHSPGAVLLHEPVRDILVGGDQILSHITPFVGTMADDPAARPLAQYIASLDEIAARVGPRTLVLPGHGLPFRGIPARVAALHRHHEARSRRILDACDGKAATIRGIVEKVFTRSLDGVMGMAMAETLSHVHELVAEGRLAVVQTTGLLRFRPSAGQAH